MAADLGTTMDALLSCVCVALADAGRPSCECGQTVGPPILGPGQCCECDETPGGQLSVALQRLYPADANTLSQVLRIEGCRPGAVAADLAFTLARCHPRVDELGQVPTLDEVAPYVDGVHDDVQIMYNALVCCSGFKLGFRDIAVDSDPEGGCSAIGVRVTVLVNPTSPVVGS